MIIIVDNVIFNTTKSNVATASAMLFSNRRLRVHFGGVRGHAPHIKKRDTGIVTRKGLYSGDLLPQTPWGLT